MATLTVNGGIGGASYNFDAPEELSTQLAQQYVDAINDAISSNTFQVIPPDGTPASDKPICQVDWNVASDGNNVDSLPDGATHLLVHDVSQTAVANFSLSVDQPRRLAILDGGSQMGDYDLSGAISGSLSVLQAARIVDMSESQGDWSIAVNSGIAWQESQTPNDQFGLDPKVKGVLLSGGNVISTSSGENHVSVSGAQNLIGLGAGTNHIVSQGQDTVFGQGITTNALADTTKGEATFNLGTSYGRDYVTINGGRGLYDLGQSASVFDNATVGSTIKVQSNSSVSGGAGSTVTFDNAGGEGTISGAAGDTISASGNLSVLQGQNQSISVEGALRFLNGTGNSTLAGGANSTVWGAQGLNAVANMSGYTIFTANQPDATGDQTYDASASSGNIEYWSGPGTSSFTSGSGDDHFVFGTAFAGTSGDSILTITGGAGANSFGVLSGHNGGNITITDFDASKGDFFFQYFYNPASASQAVQDLLATATVSGGNTTLHLDNNMQVTFLGVTNLDASAIRIS